MACILVAAPWRSLCRQEAMDALYRGGINHCLSDCVEENMTDAVGKKHKCYTPLINHLIGLDWWTKLYTLQVGPHGVYWTYQACSQLNSLQRLLAKGNSSLVCCLRFTKLELAVLHLV